MHSTQKPVALLEYLIRTYTKEDEVVMDNCMGSGSTGVACRNTGRRFIGIEAAAEGALEIVLNIKKKDTRLSVECLGLARDPIRIISKKRTEQSLRNRLIAFKNYILSP